MTSATHQPTDLRRGAVTPDDLARWVGDATHRLADLVGDLTDAQLLVPELDIVNPPLWEIGHVTWFQEAFVLRHVLGEPPLVGHGDAIWDSAAIPHGTRWYLNLPSRAEIRAYMDAVAGRVAARVAERGASEQLCFIARYAVHHHDMHTEALTYTRQTLGYPPARFGLGGDADTHAAVPGAAVPGKEGALEGDALVPGGRFALGADRDEHFVFDNEKWVHPVELAPFRISRAAVTQAEFAAFVDDGGYRTPHLWSDAGWEWRTGTDAEHPVYWRRAGGTFGGGPGAWERRHFDEWVPLEPHGPVVHVCFHEAQAYCRWAGRRLPTEAEWEAAAIGEPTGPGESTLAASRRRFPWGDEPITRSHANLDWRHAGTVDVAAFPAGDSAFGCRQMIGNVWEWTASTFGPYPGFEQDAYRDNSWPWFGSRMVLRGGAWATRARLLRSTLRNYFTPDRCDVFAGFRTAADAQ